MSLSFGVGRGYKGNVRGLVVVKGGCDWEFGVVMVVLEVVVVVRMVVRGFVWFVDCFDWVGDCFFWVFVELVECFEECWFDVGFEDGSGGGYVGDDDVELEFDEVEKIDVGEGEGGIWVGVDCYVDFVEYYGYGVDRYVGKCVIFLKWKLLGFIWN